MPQIDIARASKAAGLWKARGLMRAFIKDDSGATAIEYALIAAGIAIAIITAVKGIGTKLNTTFSSISTQLQ
jgi:pilus assembly protein Flp/PilA